MACIYSKFLADTSQSKNYVNYRENVDIYVNLQCYDIYALQFFVLKKVALGTNGLLILEGKGFENFLKQQRHQRTSVHFFLKTLKIQDHDEDLVRNGYISKVGTFLQQLVNRFLGGGFLVYISTIKHRLQRKYDTVHNKTLFLGLSLSFPFPDSAQSSELSVYTVPKAFCDLAFFLEI